MNKEDYEMKVCVFDIDGTLYNANSTFDFLEYIFSENKMYQLYSSLYHSLIWRAANRILRRSVGIDLTRRLALNFLKGLTKTELTSKANDYYKYRLSSMRIEELERLLSQYVADNGCRVIILSATLDFLAEIIANNLGIKEFYSSSLLFKDDVCQGEISNDLLGDKLPILKSIGLNEIDFFATDDFTDIPVLEVARKKVIVVYKKYSKKWNKIIAKRNWVATTVVI